MVRSAKQGGGYKNGCNLGTVNLIYFKCGQNVAKGVPWHCFCMDDVTGCTHVHQKLHQTSKGAFSAYFLPQTLKTRKDTNWGVPSRFLKYFLNVQCPIYVYSSSLLCEKIESHLVSQNSPVEARVLCQSLLPCCEMKWSSCQ